MRSCPAPLPSSRKAGAERRSAGPSSAPCSRLSKAAVARVAIPGGKGLPGAASETSGLAAHSVGSLWRLQSIPNRDVGVSLSPPVKAHQTIRSLWRSCGLRGVWQEGEPGEVGLVVSRTWASFQPEAHNRRGQPAWFAGGCVGGQRPHPIAAAVAVVGARQAARQPNAFVTGPVVCAQLERRARSQARRDGVGANSSMQVHHAPEPLLASNFIQRIFPATVTQTRNISGTMWHHAAPCAPCGNQYAAARM
jgi:hypothetical protein